LYTCIIGTVWGSCHPADGGKVLGIWFMEKNPPLPTKWGRRMRRIVDLNNQHTKITGKIIFLFFS
jgi:hypothetical protein